MLSTDRPDFSERPPRRTHWACLGLGSNQGAPRNLAESVRRLRREFDVLAVSSAWESHAVGLSAADFVNAAVLIRTELGQDDLVARLKRIEDCLGRTRGDGLSHVAIDIDLLIYDGEFLGCEPWNIAHRAVPVAELMPELAHPKTGESLNRAAGRHTRVGGIWPRPDIVLDAAEARTLRAGAADSSWATDS